MKATGARKVQTKKTNYMSDEAFADLKQALEDALAFERGERRDIHVARIQASRPSKDIMEAIEGIRLGLKSMKRNAGKPADKFFWELFADNGIPEHDEDDSRSMLSRMRSIKRRYLCISADVLLRESWRLRADIHLLPKLRNLAKNYLVRRYASRHGHPLHHRREK